MKTYTKINKKKKIIAKPNPQKTPKKQPPTKTYLFWLKSDRGTDQKAIYEMPSNYTEDSVRGELEHWCSFYGAWEQSLCSYGFKKIKVLKDQDLKNKWNDICKKMKKIKEEYDTIREMFNIRKVQ